MVEYWNANPLPKVDARIRSSNIGTLSQTWWNTRNDDLYWKYGSKLETCEICWRTPAHYLCTFEVLELLCREVNRRHLARVFCCNWRGGKVRPNTRSSKARETKNSRLDKAEKNIWLCASRIRWTREIRKEWMAGRSLQKVSLVSWFSIKRVSHKHGRVFLWFSRS